MVLTHMARIIAILLSIAAAVISVIGLAAIFSGAYLEVVIIASLLEAAKVITATWLHSNWKMISSSIKFYLCFAVIILMGITSLGIYGFFARAHIKQMVLMETGEVSRLPAIDSRIQIERGKIADYETQISQIDSALKAMTEKGRAKDAKAAIAEANKQRKTRDGFLENKANSLEVIGELEMEKSQIQAKVKEFEVEVGPLKYLAALFYDNASKDQLESAVRGLILVLIFVFDPLAIALLTVSNTFSRKQPETITDGGKIEEESQFSTKLARTFSPKRPNSKTRFNKKTTKPVAVVDRHRFKVSGVSKNKKRGRKKNVLDLTNVVLD